MQIGQIVQLDDGTYFRVDGFSTVNGIEMPYGEKVEAPAETPKKTRKKQA